MWKAFNALNRQEKFHKVEHQVNTASAKQHIDKLLSCCCPVPMTCSAYSVKAHLHDIMKNL
jgi:hypothetical protein